MRYSVLCKVYTGYCGTSEIEQGLCACTVDNPLAKAHTKFHSNQPTGSGEKDFLFSTIYGRGDHLGRMTLIGQNIYGG